MLTLLRFLILNLYLFNLPQISAQFFKHQSIHPNQITAEAFFQRKIRDDSRHSRNKRASSRTYLDPPENIYVESVDNNSIHFKWTLTNQALDLDAEVTVMIYPRDNAVEDPKTAGSKFERIITNLDAGKLYTFIIATLKDGEMAQPIVINQDTVPDRPTHLVVETFDFLDIELTFMGQQIPYRIETNGMEARWEAPAHGECDCYDADILPKEGQVIVPAKDNGHHQNTGVNNLIQNKGTTLPAENSSSRSQDLSQSVKAHEIRQFIHLVPGKEYTISVSSTTCGNGFYGPLKSETIQYKQIIPPAKANNLILKDSGENFLDICWEGPSVGHFDSFEILWHKKGNFGG